MNIGIFKIEQNGYVKFEDVIKEKKPDFAFEVDKTYVIQVLSNTTTKFCAKDSVPDDGEGFLPDPQNKPFSYTHQGGDLYVNKYAGTPTCVINIAD